MEKTPSIHISKPQTELGFSSIPATAMALTNVATRNVISSYHWLPTTGNSTKKSTGSATTLSTTNDPVTFATAATLPELYEKVVVIHPSSSTLKIGTCSKVLPCVIPNLVARRVVVENQQMEVENDSAQNAGEDDLQQEIEEMEEKLQGILRSRLQQVKKRTIPNAKSMVSMYIIQKSDLLLIFFFDSAYMCIGFILQF